MKVPIAKQFGWKHVRSIGLTATCAFLALCGVNTMAAAAAGADDSGTGDKEQIEEVIVTGTRFTNPNFSSSSPIATVSADQLISTGNSASVEGLLSQMPQFTPSQGSASNFSLRAASTVNLRGLGDQRTLVLVDGKRYVPATVTGVVDIDTIPPSLIERIDVVTGAAAAVYGSDAVAGVVNIILKHNFSGVEVGGDYDTSGRWDGRTSHVYATFGTTSSDGRGSFVGNISYSDREPIFGSARQYASQRLADGDCVPGSLNNIGLGTPSSAAGAVPCYVHQGTTNTPNGTINNIYTFNKDGSARLFDPVKDYYDYDPGSYIQVPLQRWTASSLGSYKINDQVEPYFRATFTQNNMAQQLASASTPEVSPPIFAINLANPYLTPSALAILAPLDTTGSGVANVSLTRRLIEVGPREFDVSETAFQTMLGVRGSIGSAWSYDMSYQYGRNNREDSYPGDVSVQRLRQSLLATRNTNGQIVCVNPAGGCVPADIFGAGNISPAAAQYISADSQMQSYVTEKVATGSVVGDTSPWFSLPAGPIGLVGGAEWRSEAAAELPDSTLQLDSLGWGPVLPTSGGFSVREAFTEVQVPLLKDLPFAHSLSMRGAARTADYSTVGRQFTFGGGVEWAPLAGLLFRGQYQRAVRAPNVSELFAGASSESENAIDPCSARTPAAQQTPQLRQLCIATGVPASQVFGGEQVLGTEVVTRTSGNPQLQAETSGTYTFGLTFEPQFVPGLVGSVDYYRISIANAIGTFGGGAASTIDTCYGVLQSANSVYCKAIARDPITGQITLLTNSYGNIAQLKTSGVDFQVSYTRSVQLPLLQRESELTVGTHGNWTQHQILQNEPITSVLDCVGFYGPQCGEPTPAWKLYNSASLRTGPVALNLVWRWLDAVRSDLQMTFPNPVLGIPAQFTPSSALSARISPYNYFDVSAELKLPHDIEAMLGVTNVLDKQPPVLAEAASTFNNTYSSTYSPLGRAYFLGLRAHF